ncbi:hypothetical protein M1O14_03075, partial [Dehalococcoidia bacterium]|nr:hypothetical protein [Dehalococcoidia bacterium]
IDVLTDGTISPEDAVATSARILTQQFSTFLKLGKQPEEAVAVAKEPPLPSLDVTLDQLGLSPRTYNALRRAGITSVRMLLEKTRGELIDMKYLGPKSWEEIQERLAAIGVLEKPQAAETEGEGGDEVPAEEEISEDPERAEMIKKLEESGFVVRENK